MVMDLVVVAGMVGTLVRLMRVLDDVVELDELMYESVDGDLRSRNGNRTAWVGLVLVLVVG